MSLSYVIVFVLLAVVLGVISTTITLSLVVRRIFVIFFIMHYAKNFTVFAVGDKRFRNEAKKMVSGCFG